MSRLQELQTRIAEWRDSKISSPSINGTIEHLIEEAEHLKENPYDPFALADVGILFLSCCEQAGFDTDDVLIAIASKQLINENRKWLAPDEKGIVRHKNE